MWQDHAQAPSAVVDSMYYSTNVFAARAIEKIKARAAADPLYIHLTWQNVHGPYTPPPEWETLQSAEFLSNYCGPTSAAAFPNDYRCNFGSSLKVVDDGMRNVTEALRATGRWERTLMVVSSDNGGIGPGNNHRKRSSHLVSRASKKSCAHSFTRLKAHALAGRDEGDGFPRGWLFAAGAARNLQQRTHGGGGLVCVLAVRDDVMSLILTSTCCVEWQTQRSVASWACLQPTRSR